MQSWDRLAAKPTQKRARRGGEASTVGFFGRVYLITERFSLSAKIATKIKNTTP